MKRFKKILVVFDYQNDNRALVYHAVDLAKRNQAILEVIDVFDSPPILNGKSGNPETEGEDPKTIINIIDTLPSSPQDLAPSNPADENPPDAQIDPEKTSILINEFILHEEQQDLDHFVSEIQKAGIAATSKTLYGVPYIEIIREVMRNQHDLVMIAAESNDSIKGTLFGTTALHLMRKCPCPVWVIKANQNLPFNRILAAVDLDSDDEVRKGLNHNIIELASSLARMGQSHLFIINAWRMIGESILRGRARFSSAEIGRVLRENKEIHRKMLLNLLQKHSLNDLNFEVFMLKGEASTLINDLAKIKEVDLIVMGTVSRSGISGVLIGNTAEKVMQQVDSSLLVIKPEGYISPVKLETD